jgi:hypothetical protein
LLVYTDPTTPVITGAVTTNTLTAPSPVITENLNVQPTFIRGTVDVSSKRSFVITGYINTSKGKVTTKVSQSASFSSNQYFNITGTLYTQNISQGTTLNAYTTVTQPGMSNIVYQQNYSFPLTVDISQVTLKTGNINVTTKANQTYNLTDTNTQSGRVLYTSTLDNAAQHIDTLQYDSSGNFIGNTAQSSAQQYNYFDSTNAAYNCAISAAANVLTAFSPGCAQ